MQAAISAALPGDTVLVLPGTYVERIDFLGKAIMITEELDYHLPCCASARSRA